MSTIEPRISITPSPTTGPLLRELSKVTGKPPATIVRELLDECAPALIMTLEAYRQIQQSPEDLQAAVFRMAANAHQQIAQATLDLDTATKKKPGRKPGGSGAAKPR